MEPYFFQEELPETSKMLFLDETASRHCIQVLRMQQGNRIRITDGKGHLAIAEIIEPNRRRCGVSISEFTTTSASEKSGFSIGIAFTKSNERNEWLLEKLTELGTENIYPLLTEHGERDKFNQERYQKILISAMLQSQQAFLPNLHPIQKLKYFFQNIPNPATVNRFIAHCQKSTTPRDSFLSQLKKGQKSLVLIGPEGDFSEEEICQCLQLGFVPIHLGKNRLRTETAGIYACATYNSFQVTPA